MIDFMLRKKSVEYLAIIAIAIFIGMQLNGMSLSQSVNANYTTFYTRTLMMGAISVLVMVVFGLWYFTVDPLQIGWKMSLVITGAFTAIIIGMSMSGNQIWPVPQAYAAPLTVSPLENYITSAVIPGFTEDLLYLAALPMVLVLFYAIPKETFFGGISATEFLVIAFVACFVAATGYNHWVIPGFTSAHVPAYGGAQLAYAGAWIFSMGQSIIYLITGVFAPIPHILHNAIITWRQNYAMVPAAAAFLPLVFRPEGRVKEFFMAHKLLIFGGLVLVLLVSGCMTPGEALDTGLSGLGNLTGNVINWTAGAISG